MDDDKEWAQLMASEQRRHLVTKIGAVTIIGITVLLTGTALYCLIDMLL